MDQSQAQNMNQAAQQVTQGTMQSLQTMIEQAVPVMQANAQLAQEVFQSSMRQLQQQTQAMQQMTQTLSEQAQSQQPAVQTLLQESTNAYSDFLSTATSFYQQRACGHGPRRPSGGCRPPPVGPRSSPRRPPTRPPSSRPRGDLLLCKEDPAAVEKDGYAPSKGAYPSFSTRSGNPRPLTRGRCWRP